MICSVRKDYLICISNASVVLLFHLLQLSNIKVTFSQNTMFQHIFTEGGCSKLKRNQKVVVLDKCKTSKKVLANSFLQVLIHES